MPERSHAQQPIAISTDAPIWDRFFTVSPLVLVASKEPDGRFDVAPKHMAMPLGWQNYFCFVCTPRHATYHNVRRNEAFTVSYPRPDSVLLGSLSASPRCDDGDKPALEAVTTFRASKVDGVLVEGCYLFLECELERIVDGFGSNSLIIGRITAAAALESALRRDERDENEQLYADPLLAYLSPGRFAEIRQTHAFPFPQGFSK
ncbi:MAG: flavin reductase [Planctomycetota bacterium]|nr:MAG: flavin reductase [Planctomycetota bacterium]